MIRRVLPVLLALASLIVAPLRAERHDSPSPTVAAFSNGGTVVIGWTDGVVTADGTVGGAPAREVWRAPDGKAILSVAFSADGTRLLVASKDAIQVRDWATGRVLRSHRVRDDDIEEAQISPDGRLVAMPLSSAAETLLLDLATGTERRLSGGERGGRGYDGNKSGPAFSGDLVLTYGDDPDQPIGEALFVWNRAGKLRFKVGICCGRRIAELLPGQRMLLGGSKGETTVLDLVSGAETTLPGKWPNDELLAIDGLVVAAAEDRFVVHETSGAVRGNLRYPQDRNASRLARVGLRGLALWKSGPGMLTVMEDVASDAVSGRLTLFPDAEPLAVSPDGAWIAIRTGTRAVHLHPLRALGRTPGCVSRVGDTGACTLAAALTLFYAPAEADKLDGARHVVAALRQRDVAELEKAESWLYLEAADRLAAAGAAIEARAAFAWLASSPDAEFRRTATFGIARLAAGEGDSAQAERLLIALLPQLEVKARNRNCLYCEVQAELALAYLSRGNTDAAVMAAAEAERISNDGYTGLQRARYAAVRARALLAAGRRAEALEAADRAVSIARGYIGGDSVQFQARALIEQGELLVGAGQALQGQAAASEAVDTAANGAPPASALVLEMRQRFGALRLRAGDAPGALVPLRAGAAAIAGGDALASSTLTKRWRGLFRLQVAAAWSAAHPAVTPTQTHAPVVRLAPPSSSAPLRRPGLGPLPVRHSGSVDAVSFSANNLIIATGDSEGGRLALWDARTGIALRNMADPQRGWLTRIAFTADGAGVAAVTYDGRLLAWRIGDGQPIAQPRFARPFYAKVKNGVMRVDPLGATTRFNLGLSTNLVERGDDVAAVFISSASVGLCLLSGSQKPRCVDRAGKDRFFRHKLVGFGADGRLVAVNGPEGVVSIIDPERLEVVQRIPLSRQSNSADNGVLAPDARTIVVATGEHAVQLIDGGTGALGRELSTGAGKIERLAVSHDGRQIVAGLRNGTAAVWDMTTGRRVFALGAPAGSAHEESIRTVALSADGKLGATAGDDFTVRVWNTDNGSQQRAVSLDGTALAFLGTTTLFTPGEPAVLDIATGTITRGVRGERAAQRAAVSVSGVSVTAWSKGRIETFGPDGRPLATMRDYTDGPPVTVALSPDGQRVAADDFGTVSLWNAATGEKLVQHALPGRDLGPDLENIEDLIALTDRMLYVRDGSSVRTYDAVTGGVLSVFQAPGCTGGHIAAGGGTVVFGDGSSVCVAREGQVGLAQIKVRDAGELSALAISPAGNLAALGFKDGAVILVDLVTHTVTAVDVTQQGEVTALAFARDAMLLLSGSLDRTALLINLTSGHAVTLLGR